MDHVVELYWSFRSPYSYVVLPRVMALTEKFRVSVDLRVVHPDALRNPNYFARMDPLARPYFMKDSARVAAFHGLPFRRPVPDPIAQDPTTLALAAEQPLARRLGRLGVAATERGRGLPFCVEVAKLLWDGSVTGWDSDRTWPKLRPARDSTWPSSRQRSRAIPPGRGTARRQRPGAAGSWALGGANDGIRGRAVLRAGSFRGARLADAATRAKRTPAPHSRMSRGPAGLPRVR